MTKTTRTTLRDSLRETQETEKKRSFEARDGTKRTTTTESTCLAKYFPQPLRLAKPLQHRRAPLQAVYSAPSSADSSPVGGPEKHEWHRKTRNSTHVTFLAGQCSAAMYSWTLRRRRSMPDACRRLRTLATVQHGSTEIQALMSAAARTRSSLQPCTHRRETQMTRREMWDETC